MINDGPGVRSNEWGGVAAAVPSLASSIRPNDPFKEGKEWADSNLLFNRNYNRVGNQGINYFAVLT